MPKIGSSISDNGQPKKNPPSSNGHAHFLGPERMRAIKYSKPSTPPEKCSEHLKTVLSHFDERTETADGYCVQCPAHDDGTPSLHIAVGKDGQILMHCKAGCETEVVLERAGLTFQDLYPPEPPKADKGRKHLEATYDYKDEDGELLFQVMRYRYDNGKKTFSQRRPLGKGKWAYNLDGVERVPYRLDEVTKAKAKKSKLVFAAEGEKDVDCLWGEGLVATCNPGGAGKWKDEYSEYLRDWDVVTLRDNDDAGERHRDQVAASVFGVARSVKNVELPGLSYKEDVSDWFAAGHTSDELLALVDETEPLTALPINIKNKLGDSGTIEDGLPINIKNKLGPPAYHGPIGDFLKAVDPYTEATAPGILAHLLTAIGMYVGTGPYFYAGTPQHARLFSVVVGGTNGGRKGTASYIVDALMKKVNESLWSTQRVDGLSSGEGLIEKVSDKYTKNKDGEVEVEEVEKRLYVCESELSRILANMRRETNILSQVIRAAWDTGNLGTLTVNPRHATNAHICIVAHITPEELRATLTNIEMANGFGNRFLWFHSQREKLIPHTKEIPDRVFSPLVNRLKQVYLSHEGLVQFDQDAKERWEEIYPGLSEDLPGLAGKMVARGAPIVCRLALIYALVDEATKISVEHLEAAMAVWDYCNESAHAIFGSQSATSLEDKVLRLLTNGPMTKNDFNSHLSPGEKKAIGDTLAQMEASGKVTMTKHKPPRGRPSEVWSLVTGDP